LIFYRGACNFRSIIAILTKPPILDISTPFAISGLSIKTEQEFDLPIIHTEPQLPTLRSNRVTVSRSSLKLICPVGGVHEVKTTNKIPGKDFCSGDLDGVCRRRLSSCSYKMARWTLPHEQSCYKLFYSTRRQLTLLRSWPCSDR
jgi:hypothetical protein